ncbi:MAG: helix-turn-helix domain-containing protein [Prevotella sp.]|nr:helix-turn-helix domain-containing protein [Prevotella sp.]
MRHTEKQGSRFSLRQGLIALLLVVPVMAAAVYLFKTIDGKDGLTSSQINCVMKDKFGYMWFGTPAGLYRYDGYVFKSFQCNSQDGSSLPDSYINSIQEGLDGNLWINTAAGYCIYNPQSESFERDMKHVFSRFGIQSVPSIVYIDQHHNLWGAIPNRGVVCYNMQQQQHYEFGYTGDAVGVNDAIGVPRGNVCSISECRDGALIVYDDGRIVCLDVMHQQRRVWQTNEIADRKLRRSRSLKAFADQMDNIWLYGQGTLFFFNKSSKTWNTSFGDQLGLTGVGVDHAVNGMAGDRNGNVWIGTDRAGLLRMNVNTHEMEEVQPRNINTHHWIADVVRVQSLYVDNTDLLWVGTEKSGVAYSGNNIYRFESQLVGDITAIAQADSGRVWYGTGNNGIVGYNGPLASQKVSAMVTTKDGSLWVGSKQNGMTRIKDGNATIYSAANDEKRTIIDDHVNALCSDRAGNVWIATNGGLQVYNPRMNSFSNYTRENGKLKSNNITSLFNTKDNRLLVGTGEGLSIVSLSNNEILHLTGNRTNLLPFTNNYITQVYEDSRGLIWVGTREGANVLNLENDSLNYLTEKQGLCNNNVCGITEDKNHNMWITTSNGISRVVVQRNANDGSTSFGLYNYSTADGLQSNEFNIGSIFTKSDGNVLFGGLYGVNWTSKPTGEGSDALPTVILTQFMLGEEEVKIGHAYDGRVILTQSLNSTTKLELNHDQNTFTIKFAAGNYNQSERLQFMYAVDGKGFNNTWRDGDALKHGVTFRNLSSGTYKLQVKAVNAAGITSNNVRTIEIEIERHWLLSWWMLLSYLVVFIIIVYIWRIGFKQAMEVKARKIAVIDELKRQREEIKSAADDINQPMSRMATIISNLSEKDTSFEEREQLNALHAQMLQVVTRVADMQLSLENPENSAKQSVKSHYQLDAKGEMNLPDLTSDDTVNSRPRRTDAPTSNIVVFFIDDNIEFLKFVKSRLRDVYDFHVYNDIYKAAQDIITIKADLVVCKHNMKGMTGSELCNRIKMNPEVEKVKFVLVTDSVLTPQDMKSMNISMAADDYLVKPFNLQEAVMKFNAVLGLGLVNINSDLIEGAETRMLEDHNSSMTTSTETLNIGEYSSTALAEVGHDDEMKMVETTVKSKRRLDNQKQMADEANAGFQIEGETVDLMSEYSMVESMDRQLLKNIEQYVLQNMSRGQINLEEMANAMGMGRVPFFHRVRSITGKTPTELVRDLRLKHACILLKRTNINMSELAANVGFMTGENFIKVFKEKFGLSPLEYRLKHRK